MPTLVIHIEGEPGTPSIVSLTPASFGTPRGYGSSLGTISVVGGNGQYGVANEVNPATAIGYLEVNGFNPGSDEEIYAIDVKVNGAQADSAEISQLVNAINDGDNADERSIGVFAAATYAGLPTHDSSPFGSQYNLFVDAATGPSDDNFLGLDMSVEDDPNFVGYTFTSVAVVPEPMSLGILAIGGLGMLRRRNRRGI